MRAGSVDFRTPMLWAIGFIVVSAIGGLGLGGLLMAKPGANRAIHDTYYVAAQMHHALWLEAWWAAAFGIFAAWYYLFPKITGRTYSDLLGKVHFWLSLIGANAVLVPHVILLPVMWRWVADDADALRALNLVSLFGSYTFAAGIFVFFANMVLAFLRRRPAD